MSTATSTEPQPLTARQRDVFRYLYETTRDQGYQPSYQEIAENFDFAFHTGAQQALGILHRKGWIRLSSASPRAVRFLYRPDGTPFDGFADKPGRAS